MMNWLWFFLIAVSVVYGTSSGRIALVTSATLQAATNTVTLMIEICGIMSLWLGMLKIAEASGMVKRLGELLSPLIQKLFPSIPPRHEAFSAIIMNVSANLLGLGNAATPFGLKAMEYLQTINPQKDEASPAMITLLALNTSCITLVPTMMISLRAAAGSAEPTAIMGATILSSGCGLLFAVLLDRLLRACQQRRRK